MPTEAVDREEAQEILSVHRPDELGGSILCVGCIELWGVGRIHPCLQAEWAQSVLKAGTVV